MNNKVIIICMIACLLVGFVIGASITRTINCRGKMWITAKGTGRQICNMLGYEQRGSIGVTDNKIDYLSCYNDTDEGFIWGIVIDYDK